MNTALEMIKKDKVVAIARKVPVESITKLAEALLLGGLHCIEVTFDHASAQAEAETLVGIRMLTEKFGDSMAIGAGTVLKVEEVIAAHAAGAKYIISPNTDAAVIAKTKELGMLSIPGAFTPPEIVEAYALGADFVKLFPAANFGTAYIKAVRAPLSHIPVLAVGGVNPENIGSFLAAGCAGAGCGGGLVSLDAIKKGDFASITAVARAYTEAVLAAQK